MNFPSECPTCGAASFAAFDVLWPDLIRQWELLPYEVEYINRQQGIRCTSCGCNLRSMGLAAAIVQSFRFRGTLSSFLQTSNAQALRVLEVNEAGGLTPFLSTLPGHHLTKYPECDMTDLPMADGTYDLVVHSDTLEHVPDPLAGLRECRRVLRPRIGKCMFTVPMIVGRLSRSRAGLAISSHAIVGAEDDCTVHTEFGADAWKYAVQAGFSSVRMMVFEYPAAITIEAV